MASFTYIPDPFMNVFFLPGFCMQGYSSGDPKARHRGAISYFPLLTLYVLVRQPCRQMEEPQCASHVQDVQLPCIVCSCIVFRRDAAADVCATCNSRFQLMKHQNRLSAPRPGWDVRQQPAAAVQAVEIRTAAQRNGSHVHSCEHE